MMSEQAVNISTTFYQQAYIKRLVGVRALSSITLKYRRRLALHDQRAHTWFFNPCLYVLRLVCLRKADGQEASTTWERARLARRMVSAAGHPSKPTQPKHKSPKPPKHPATAANQNSKSQWRLWCFAGLCALLKIRLHQAPLLK